ncbi:MAG: hypothetical protein ISR58_16645 [Anaerolineales bacterium]|nr:hypothetical protein [Chloroflexota bacterium]MBL6982803.1 hypothetical protein [Anaerolineales bacterium]
MTNTRLLLGLGLLAVLLASCAPSATSANQSNKNAPEPFRIIAYATEAVIESLIPYDKLTHINYSFLTPKADGTFNQISNGWKLKLIVQNAHAKDVKVLISVGGWGWDKEFETLAADPSLRSAFVQNLKSFVDEYQLDGADVDWEYPDAGQSAQNFLVLMQELRAAMPDKLFTTAVVAHGENGMGILAETFELFDFVNIMTYDGPDHGSMEQFERGLSFWSDRGLPKDKIVMGLPFYGDPNFAYFKIVKEDPAAAQKDIFDFYGTIYHYNGIPTVKTKTKMAMEEAGGIMFWTLDFDAQGEYSLVNAIYQTVYP